MRKPVMCGLGPLVDKNWKPIRRDRAGAEATGRRVMPGDLKTLGFGVAVFDAGDYYRISFGRKGASQFLPGLKHLGLLA